MSSEVLSWRLAIFPDELSQIQAILTENIPRLTVWAYGSRVHHKHLKSFSDLDLVVFSKLDDPVDSLLLQEIFAESNLPFNVDVSIWERLPDWLQQQIQRDHIVLQDCEHPEIRS